MKRKAASKAKVEQGLSERDEQCGGCGDPLFVCPATVRHSVRCCSGCTHRTQEDVDYELALAAQERQRRRQRGRG